MRHKARLVRLIIEATILAAVIGVVAFVTTGSWWIGLLGLPMAALVMMRYYGQQRFARQVESKGRAALSVVDED